MKFNWMKNTDGRPDAVLTMTFVGFIVVVVKILLGGATIEYDGTKYSFGELDAAVVGALLTPTLGSYVARRWTDKKFKSEEKKVENNEKDELRDSIQ